MDAFVDAWLKGVYPLRTKSGFKIEKAWVVKEKNKFIWVLSYDGPEGFEAKDSAYYASEKRKILDPDPAQYIADVEKYFIEAVRQLFEAVTAEITVNSFGWCLRTSKNQQAFNQNITMRKLIIPVVILAFIACNSQPIQNATTNVQKSDFGFDNLRGKVETIESEAVNFDSTGKAKGDSTHSIGAYDKATNIVKETVKDNSGVTTINEVTYYANGFSKEEKTTVNGTVMVRVTIDSVIKGQHTGAKVWDSTGKQIGYCDVIYNDYGQVTWGKTFYMNGKLQFGWESKFDRHHYIGGSRTDSTGKIVFQSTQKLNDKDDPAEEQYTEEEEGVSTTTNLTYKYDSYDEKGNWTQRSTYKNGKLKRIVKRTITYYKD